MQLAGHYLWLDLETTGTDDEEDAILEVAWILTDATLAALDHDVALVDPRPFNFDHLDPDVRAMHDASGLLREITAKPYTSLDTATLVQGQIIGRCRRFEPDARKVALAGSGVAHFDQRFIRRQMPALDDYLYYAPLDVGQVRRFLMLAGIDCDSLMEAGTAKTHRAASDVEHHLAEGRAYLKALQGAFF